MCRTRRLLLAKDAAGLGTWDYDPRVNTVTWDEHTAALGGLRLEDFGGTVQAFLDVVHPQDRDGVLATLTDSAVTGGSCEAQYRVVWPDGSVRELLLRGQAQRDRHGRVVRLVGACVDVTDVGRASREREGARHAESAALLEMLQRSLLTTPPQPDHVQVAVRYAAASESARIGGDWYDALLAPDGALVLVIGDFAGHDQAAAVSMATVRNLLRAIAYTVQEPPAAVLAALEATMAGLEITALGTAVLGRLTQPPELRDAGARRLTWSNAGHLPPLLHSSSGTALLAYAATDVLLGLAPDTIRANHDVLLPRGATLLLYTDGLVERRGEDLDIGIERLRAMLDELAHLPLEQLCDELLSRLLPTDGAEDDVALLAVRLHDEAGAAAAERPTLPHPRPAATSPVGPSLPRAVSRDPVP